MEFRKWLEDQIDHNQPTQIMGSTNTNSADATHVSPSAVSLQATHNQTNDLAATHGRLKDIFVKIRQKMDTFRDPTTKKAFEREMVKGIDGVGRSHAILAAQ